MFSRGIPVHVSKIHINMIWSIVVFTLGLASVLGREFIDPEHLNYLRASGQYDEFARLMGIDVNLIRPDGNEERSEGYPFNKVSRWGDILLTEEQERNAVDFAQWPGNQWPNGVISYAFSDDFTRRERRIIEQAIARMNNDLTNVEVVPRTNEDNFVYIMHGNGCWSWISMIGGAQELSLGDGCLTQITIIHEFLHAVGFHHEQNRHDRDNFVTILWGNITEDWWPQYEKVSLAFKDPSFPYDPYSIMHYPFLAPYTDKAAFEMHDKSVDTDRLGKGENNSMTKLDVEKVNSVYGKN